MTQKIFSFSFFFFFRSFHYNISLFIYFPRADGSDGKESACNEGDPGSNPGSGRSPGEGNGNPLQYSCLENSMDRCYSPWGHKESDTTERLILSLLTFMLCSIQDLSSLPQGSNQCPLQWEHRVLATSLSRKSPRSILHQLIFADQLMRQSKKMYIMYIICILYI